jgi:ABC-type glycerol-3-phosphate transport system substrate-binding protein
MPQDASEAQGVRQGWEEGLKLIQRISANARYFTDSASKIPLEVSRGDAAAGMAIESYGRAAEDYVRRPDGWSRVGFVAPPGGTSVSVDPIGMLRGAPDPELATAFMEFVLSLEGQKLWAYRPGTPGGPAETALRRLPVRRDFYTDENRRYMADGHERPYARADSFAYRREWTGPVFGAIRFLIRVMCADTHQEQKRAWQALIDHGLPPAALAVFHDLSRVTYDEALRTVSAVLRAKDKVQEVRLARELGDAFRDQYRRAYEFAVAGAQSP